MVSSTSLAQGGPDEQPPRAHPRSGRVVQGRGPLGRNGREGQMSGRRRVPDLIGWGSSSSGGPIRPHGQPSPPPPWSRAIPPGSKSHSSPFPPPGATKFQTAFHWRLSVREPGLDGVRGVQTRKGPRQPLTEATPTPPRQQGTPGRPLNPLRREAAASPINGGLLTVSPTRGTPAL